MPPLACVLAPPRRRCLLQFSPALLQIQKPAHWPVRPANRRPGRGDNQAVEPRISGEVTLAWVRVQTSVPSVCECVDHLHSGPVSPGC